MRLIRPLRNLRRLWPIFHLLQNHLDSLIQLCVNAIELVVWVVVDDDVRVNAVSFDNPVAALVEWGELRTVQRAAVDKWQAATNSNHTAP